MEIFATTAGQMITKSSVAKERSLKRTSRK